MCSWGNVLREKPEDYSWRTHAFVMLNVLSEQREMNMDEMVSSARENSQQSNLKESN